MNVVLTKRFHKQLRAFPRSTQSRFWERAALLLEDSRDPILRDHQLAGKYAACRSINITGDIRAIYTVHEETVHFLLIGTHSELYE